MRTLILVLFALILAACAASPVVTATRLITREQAIAVALKTASVSAPEISSALVPPTNVQAVQITLGEALQRMGENGNPPQGYNRTMPVWYVTMDGLWEGGMPYPGVTETPVWLHHYILVLDAATGREIESRLRP